MPFVAAELLLPFWLTATNLVVGGYCYCYCFGDTPIICLAKEGSDYKTSFLCHLGYRVRDGGFSGAGVPMKPERVLPRPRVALVQPSAGVV